MINYDNMGVNIGNRGYGWWRRGYVGLGQERTSITRKTWIIRTKVMVIIAYEVMTMVVDMENRNFWVGKSKTGRFEL